MSPFGTQRWRRGRRRGSWSSKIHYSLPTPDKLRSWRWRMDLPMIGFKPHAEAGALMEYGVDLADLYSRSAAFVYKILKGTPPADLPIERAVKFDLVVNLKTAKRSALSFLHRC